MVSDLRAAASFLRAPLSVPLWDGAELRALAGALARREVVEGPAVAALEAAIARRFGVDHVVGTNLGRTAISLALQTLGRPGDEVVIPTFMGSSVGDAAVKAGWAPVFCDVDHDWNISPESFAASITPRTRAVVVAHMYGNPARIDDVLAIARPRSIRVIENATGALGACSGGRLLGTLGDVGILSMNVGKSVVAGGGGFLLTADPDVIARVRRFAFEPRPSRRVVRRALRAVWTFRLRRYSFPLAYAYRRLLSRSFSEPWTVSRLANLEAAVGLVQLHKADAAIHARRENAWHLSALLAGDPAFEVPRAGDEHIFTRFVLRLRGELGPAEGLERGPGYVAFAREMTKARVEVEWPHQPLHLRPEFAHFRRGALPVAETRWRALIALPVDPTLQPGDITYVAATARSAAGCFRADGVASAA